MKRRAKLTRIYATRMTDVGAFIDRLAARLSEGDEDLFEDLRQEGRLGALFFAPKQAIDGFGFQLQIRAAVAHRIFWYATREREHGVVGIDPMVAHPTRLEARHA